jgi:2,3,4,5-tetrahydropyridine-2-carboxylate N-succinyltransferase
MNQAQATIDQAWEERASLAPGKAPAALREAIEFALQGLDAGTLRVAEKLGAEWVTHQWLKKAVLLSFRLADNAVMPGAFTQYYDKVPGKFAAYDAGAFGRGGFRVVGSCAQIGKNVHLSGGVGIGGVLEPVQANPVIIEDNCFIGARSEVVEGVIVEENSVLSMGVFIGQSTKIFDRETGEIRYGRVPAGSVVVPGTLPSGDRSCALYCAVIVKKVDARTRAKTSLNDLLRGD